MTAEDSGGSSPREPASTHGLIVVSVVYATLDDQEVIEVSLPQGANLRQAIEASALAQRYGLDMLTLRVGIFGQLKRLDDTLQAGDRVEIYRPLLVDPMTARRQRAAAKARKPGQGRSKARTLTKPAAI